MRQTEQVDLVVDVKTLEGVKKYNFVALKRKEAARIFHGVLGVVVEAIARVSESKDADRVAAILDAVKALDFDRFWALASALLRNVIVDGTEIGPLDTTDYFETRPEELYIATVYAVLENWPKVFSKVRGSLSGFAPPDLIRPGSSSVKTASTPVK
jgi:hypothetical protein